MRQGLLSKMARCSALCAAALAANSALGVGNVVISQVWGGGNVTSGTPNADYVELLNRSASPVSLNGWSLNVASATGTAWGKLDLPNITLQPGQYFLVQVTTAGATGTALPAVDAIFNPQNTSLSSTGGKVALRNVTTAIGAVNCPPIDASLVDLMTYGTSGTCFEGAGRAPAGSTSGSGLTPTRGASGCVDTDNNNTDFSAVIPSPRNTASAFSDCSIQGACCNDSTGVCSISAGSGGCVGTYQGNNTTCAPNPCPPTGACCTGTTGTTCTLLTNTGCLGVSGFYQGNGSVCSPTPCTTASCCLPNGTCCNLLNALCTSQGGTVGVGSCSVAGNCISTPANDTCASAVSLTLGSTFVGNNFAATSTGDGPNPDCTTGATTKGVWFTFTPATTSIYELTTCGSTFDTVLTVLTVGNCADPLTYSAVSCDDDACPTGTASFCGTTSSSLAAVIGGVQLNAGTTYRIRLQLFGTTATNGGNYTITINNLGNLAFGACCNNTSAQCELRTSAACTGASPAGTYQGDGTTCSPTTCTASGACCLSGGVCLLRPSSGCTGTNVYQGDGTSCNPNPCITGACCNNTSGACTTTTSGGCSATSSTYQGDNTTCTPSPCPAQGSCCNACTSACTTTVQAACTGVWTQGAACSPNLCNSGAAPSNDEPAGAIALTLGVTTTGEITNATISVGPAVGCDTTVSKDMWYSFQPTSTSYYSVSTCGATFDTVVTVFNSADLATSLACDTDTCVGGSGEPVVCGTGSSSSSAAIINLVLLNSGTTYLIRVESGTTSTTTPGGTFPILVSTVSAGACCNNTTGACSVGLASACSATTSTYQGDATSCTPSPCPASGSCCNTCTSACTTTIQAACASPNAWTSGGVCTPNPCFGAAPANDLACGAIPLSLNTPISAFLAGATSTDDGPAASCQTDANKGVWYSFNPLTSGDYTITSCGATFDSVITVFTGDCNTPASLVEVGCDDDTCVGGATDPVVCGTGTSSTAAALVPVVTMNAGTTYLIRVQVFSTGTGGTFPLTIKTATSGACCSAAGTCTSTLAELCASPSAYFLGQACSPDPCPPTGACCDNCGNCTVTFQTSCSTIGAFQGVGTTCTVNPCTSTGAPPNDLCANATVINTFPYSDVQCTENATNDGPPGSCDSFGQTTVMTFSVWYRYTATQTGTLTVVIDYITWQGNRFSTMHATADTNCPTTTATEIMCGPTDPTNYVINTVPGTTYWICVGDEGTILTDEGGTYSLNVTFVPDAPPGVCCRGSTCSTTVSQAACTTSGTQWGASFATGSAACNATGVATTPCCHANYDKSGDGIQVADIFAYLNDWFASNAFADFGGTGSGTPDVSDIFSFLNAWFSGGC